MSWVNFWNNFCYLFFCHHVTKFIDKFLVIVVSKSFYCNILCYFVTFCWQKYQPSENKKGGGPSVIPYSLDTSLQTNLFRTTDLMSLKQSVQQAFLVLSWIQQKVQHPLLLVEDHHLHYPQSKCFFNNVTFYEVEKC